MPAAIGFLGFGEVGYFMSKGFGDEGLGPVYAFDAAGSDKGAVAGEIAARAGECGVVLCAAPGELVNNVDVVISAVPAKHAYDAASEVLKHDGDINLYVDVSTAKPTVKKHLEKLFLAKGILYADSAIMGPLPNHLHKVPILASGNGADKWRELMTPWGMRIDAIEGEAGTATAIKLVRSVFMKGLEALLVESFLFARKSGVEDIVLKSLSETLDEYTFAHTANRMMGADLVHAGRRAFEVGESVELMEEAGIEPIMAQAVIKRLRKSASLGTRYELGGVPPKTLSETYSIWIQKGHS